MKTKSPSDSKPSLFISDLHLQAEQAGITRLFLKFLEQHAKQADSLYILGDLFEYWMGDDDPTEWKHHCITALKQLSQSGVKLYFIHGNRDFLIANDFAQQTGCELLPDPSIITINHQKILIMHGDTLCTDDIEYQKFRQMVRSPQWQQALLAKTVEQRFALAQQYREASSIHKSNTAHMIMDVNQTEVAQIMRQHQVFTLIHGHTHRPNIHQFQLDKQMATRIVLAQWTEQQGQYGCWDENGYQSIVFI